MAQATEKSFPFDSVESEGQYDREYNADDFARYFRAFISSGIFLQDAESLQVVANNDMTVTLKPGRLIIDGYSYENDGDIILQVDPADGVMNRIDRVSATWSKEDRDIHCTIQKGTPSYEPVAPECRRDAEHKDYVVADIYIGAGVISIRQMDITDQRMNTDLCGVAAPFAVIDTSSIFDQYQAAVDDFLTYADTCIDGTVAGNLRAELENKVDKTGEAGDTIMTFVEAAERVNIVSGEKSSVLLGKIQKWFSDLAAAAFRQVITSYPDLMANTVAGYLVDALAVKEGFDEVNSNFTKYNSDTDMLDVYVDGALVGSLPCSFKIINLLAGDYLLNWSYNANVCNLVTNASSLTVTLKINGSPELTTRNPVTLNSAKLLTLTFNGTALHASGAFYYSADGVNFTELKTFTETSGTVTATIPAGTWYIRIGGYWSYTNDYTNITTFTLS